MADRDNWGWLRDRRDSWGMKVPSGIEERAWALVGGAAVLLGSVWTILHGFQIGGAGVVGFGMVGAALSVAWLLRMHRIG